MRRPCAGFVAEQDSRLRLKMLTDRAGAGCRIECGENGYHNSINVSI